MIDEIADRIRARGTHVPTRQDIADLLRSVGKSGQYPEAKRAAVQELLSRLHHSGLNSQGFSLLEDLESYGEF